MTSSQLKTGLDFDRRGLVGAGSGQLYDALSVVGDRSATMSQRGMKLIDSSSSVPSELAAELHSEPIISGLTAKCPAELLDAFACLSNVCI